MSIFGRIYASRDMARPRKELSLPVLGEASDEDFRYTEGNFTGLQGSQVVVPQVTRDDGGYTVCGS